MYLTVFAVFIIAVSTITGGLGVYSDGTVYVRESSFYVMAILLAVFDFIYEAAIFLSKLLIKQEKEKPSSEKPRDIDTKDRQGITK